MKKIYRICQAAFVATVLTACADYDNGFEQKKMEYEKNFKELFGAIDPNQDWNMAKQYKATVDLGENVNGTLKIYTDAPFVKDSKYLGFVDVVNGKATLNFDALGGGKSVLCNNPKLKRT